MSSKRLAVALLCFGLSLIDSSLYAQAQNPAPARPLSPFAPRFGNGCQTQTLCASIERLGLYAGAALQGALTDTRSGRETALGGTLSLGFDFIRRVAIEAHFATAAIHVKGEPRHVAAGPLTLGARLSLGPSAPTLFSEKLPARWSLVLGTQLAFRLPRAAGDPRHVGALALYAPQPSAHAAIELNWGLAQLSPSIGILGEARAAYLQLGLRTSLRLASALSVDVEALSWLPASVPDEPGRCNGGTRAGIGLRGVLIPGVLGILQYSAGAGDCEPTHSFTLGASFAFGEYPLRKIPTPDEVGVQRLWLGRVDPVLDCNGWMLDEESLLPLFRYGEPDPADPTLIRRGEESYRVGEHFDIDRRGRLYRPHQYVALANEQEFKPASIHEKLALPECSVGPRHRFHTECRILRDNLAQAQGYGTVDRMFGVTAPLVMAMQLNRKCLAEDEADNPHRLATELADILAASRGLRPVMGVHSTSAGSAGGAPPAGRPTASSMHDTSIHPHGAGSGSRELLDELSRSGIKHSPEKIVRIARKPDGQIVFLERGDSRSGLQHVLDRHGDDFAARGIPKEEIPDAIMKALTEGRVLGTQGQGSGRPVYKVSIDGSTQFISITTGNNGYVVGANPTNRAVVDKLLGRSE